MTHKTIYLDHAASTPLSESARTAMKKSFDRVYGNPSSIHSVGRAAHDAVCRSREQIAVALGIDPNEIVFTGSGTESDNLAILGLARAHRTQGNHVIVSSIEHKAVLAAARQLEKEGFMVTYLPVDSDGVIAISALENALRPETILVSIMYANNEIGSIEPISEVVRVCGAYAPKSQYPLVHTDACQAVGMMSVAPRMLGVDALTMNSAKIYGPKGIGLLYVRHNVAIEPLVVGGDQEYRMRAGTENAAVIEGFAEALVEAIEQTETYGAAMYELQRYFIDEIVSMVPKVRLNGHSTKRLPNNVHITIPDIEGEALVLMLDEYGICCATGSACSSFDLKPSHVLSAIGQEDDLIHGSLRFTFGRSTTKDELKYTARALGEVVKRLRSVTACTTIAYQNFQSVTL